MNEELALRHSIQLQQIEREIEYLKEEISTLKITLRRHIGIE